MDKNQLKKIISLVKYKLFNFSEEEWKWLLEEFGYTGEYSLFYFE